MEPVALRSLDDLRHYSQSLALRRIEDDRVVRVLLTVKHLAWLAMLVGAYLFYYLMDRLQQALNMLA